jgi:hypothetical protein
MLIALAVICAFAWYVMKPEERTRALRPVRAACWRLTGAMRLLGRGGRAWAAGIGARRPWAFAVVGIVAIVFLGTLSQAGRLRQQTDITPEIERLVSVEERTAQIYEAAVARFTRGVISADALVSTIDDSVVLELRRTRERLRGLRNVRTEQRALLAHADEYLRMRDQSWQLRADALQKRSMAGLREADRLERVSLDAFDRLQHAEPAGSER